MHVLGSVTQFLQFQCASSIALAMSLKNGVSKAPVGYLHRAVPCCCKQALPVLSAAGGPAVVSTWCCLQAHVLRPWWAGSFAWLHADHSHMASPCPMPGQVMSLPESYWGSSWFLLNLDMSGNSEAGAPITAQQHLLLESHCCWFQTSPENGRDSRASFSGHRGSLGVIWCMIVYHCIASVHSTKQIIV